MKLSLYKRALSLIMTMAMLLSWVMLPAAAAPADEAVTVELTGYAGYGTETSTGKHFAFATAAASKTALAATSWFAGASTSGSYGSFTTLTGKVLVDGMEEDVTLRFNPSGSALYIEKSQTYLEAGKTIVVPKESVFTATKSNGGTLANGGQIQFAKTYVFTYDTATQKPVMGERVSVELIGYAFNTETSSGKHYAFTPSDATKAELAATTWFAGATASTSYGSFTTMTGKILVDGVEEEATLRFNKSGSGLYIEKSQTYLEAGKTVVLPKANVFTVTQSNGGTIPGSAQIQFAKTYKLTYDTANSKPVLEVVIEVAAKDKVTVELDSYAWMSQSSVENGYGFSMSAATKTALTGTSWFGNTSGGDYGRWTRATGKVLVDGVETEVNIVFQASQSAVYIANTVAYLTAGKTVVIPKDNVFTVNRSYGGTLDNGGQIQFAKSYKLTYDAANQKPVLGVEVAAKEKVTVALEGYAFNTETSTGKHYAFAPSNATKTALAATSWFTGATASTNYGSFTTLTGKILVDGVEETATLRFNKSGSGLYIEKSQTYLEAGKVIVLPEENVFTVTRSNGGTLDNGGQIQFAKTYELAYDTATQKPVLNLYVAANDKVTLELTGYAGYSNGTSYAFSTAAASKTALAATSWFAGASTSTNINYFTRLTGKVLVNGVEEAVTLKFNPSGSAVYISDTITHLSAGKTVVIPKDNVFTVEYTNGVGDATKGTGQIQFAKTYELTYNAETSKPVLGVEVAAKEKVTVELEGYAFNAETSTGKHYAFTPSNATKTALAATSWFTGATASTNYGSFTTLTGKILVDGVAETATLRFNKSGSGLYIEKSQTYLEAGKSIVLPKENVFTVTRSNGGTTANGGQIQFAKSYKLTYDAATQKPVLGLDPKDCTHVWDAATGTCTLCKTACEHTSVTSNKCDTCGHMVYAVQDMQVAFDQVDSKNNWSFTFNTNIMLQTKAYLKGTALVDGVAKTVYFHYYEVDKGAFAIYPQCFSGGVVPADSFKLEKDTVLEAWTAPNGSKILGVPEYRISETLEVKKTNGVWRDSSTTLLDMQVAFDKVDGSNNWSFTFTTDTLPQTKAYLKGTALVDGVAKTVYFHYYEVGKAAFAIYPQCFSGGVVPTDSFKLEKGTVLEAWTAPNGKKVKDVPYYQISEDLEVKKVSGVWLDTRTPIQDVQIFYDQVDATRNYWYFTAKSDHLPTGSVYLQAQALVDGVEQTVFFHYTGPNGVYIYSQCFTKGVPTEIFQLLPGTLLVQCATPNSGRIPGAPVLMVTNETTANKAEGILWVGTSKDRPAQTPVDPIKATVEYAGTTQNMLWLRVTTNDGKKLKEIYGNRQVLKGSMLVGLLNKEEGVTEYKLENVSFQVLDGSLYVSVPGLNALEKVYISAGTVLTPTDSATSDRTLVLENDFHLERNKRDKWELRSEAVDTPQTGDSFNPALLISLMALSLVGMTVTLVFYRKKKESF